MDYSKLGMVTALFPKVPLCALTATASRMDREVIVNTLCMKNVTFVIGNIDRPNIYIEKILRQGYDDDALEEILMPIMKGLIEKKVEYPFNNNLPPASMVRICIQSF